MLDIVNESGEFMGDVKKESKENLDDKRLSQLF